MEGNYEVTFANRTVGKVQVLQQGLYYRFVCRCSSIGEEIYRLVITCGEKQLRLGVLVPEGDSFVLNRKLPAKQLPDGIPVFSIAPMHEAVQGKFVPICPEEPFAYIGRLKDAFLMERNGQIGALIRE